MTPTTASISERGGRRVNEDCWGSRAVDRASCWVVADGLGGHRGGERASRAAVDAILESFAADPCGTREALERHLAAAHAAVRGMRDAEAALRAMSTTAVVLVCDEASAVWAHVGDSRLYVLRDGALVFQTRDHSVPQRMADAGEIATAAIRGHEDRSRLLRTIGGEGEARPTVAERAHPLRPGDAFLLCTDGFWEHVTETEIEVDFARSRSAGEWIGLLDGRRAARAPAAGDNYTALAVVFDGD